MIELSHNPQTIILDCRPTEKINQPLQADIYDLSELAELNFAQLNQWSSSGNCIKQVSNQYIMLQTSFINLLGNGKTKPSMELRWVV